MLIETTKLELPPRVKIAEFGNVLELGMAIGSSVLYKGNAHKIISIYSERSPLCGYVLLSGIGNPILASTLKSSL